MDFSTIAKPSVVSFFGVYKNWVEGSKTQIQESCADHRVRSKNTKHVLDSSYRCLIKETISPPHYCLFLYINVICRDYRQLKSMNEMTPSHRLVADQYAIEHNNAGVTFYMGLWDIDSALHHFRQAVSLKLAAENQALASSPETSEANNFFQHIEAPVVDTETFQQRCISPDSTDDISYDQLDMSSSAEQGTSARTFSAHRFSFNAIILHTSRNLTHRS